MHRPVELLHHEREVEDPDDAAIHQVDEQREPLTGHPVAGELDDQVVHRTHRLNIPATGLVNVLAHRFLLVPGRRSHQKVLFAPDRNLGSADPLVASSIAGEVRRAAAEQGRTISSDNEELR